MWIEPDPAIVVANRRYPLVAADLDDADARRTADDLEKQGFNTRRRVYHPLGSQQRRHAVYATRPRRQYQHGR